MGKEKTPNITRSEVIATFYKTNYYLLFGFALYLTSNKSDAEELTATFFKKLCELPIGELEKMNAKDISYSLRILRNLNIDLFRKKKARKEREKNYSERTEKMVPRSPEDILLTKEKTYLIKKTSQEVLANEDKIIRVAFYLKTERGLKNKVLAESLGMSPNTLATKIRRIRLKIKEKIG